MTFPNPRTAFRGVGDPAAAGQYIAPAAAFRDVFGRMKITAHQNIYEADFEYGSQPMRWEQVTAGGGTISHQPGIGGVRMRIGTASGDLTIRQSRPYMRYQPGKTMQMATAIFFGAAQTNQRQRVGFFDDSNGVFFEQADPTATNPFGMFCCYRSDVNGLPVDTRFSIEQWSDVDGARDALRWDRIQMAFIEYAWYGAGTIRWGVLIDGVPRILHQIGVGNLANQQVPWARTGNLPVRYEQRNIGPVAAQNDMVHWGVSVLVDGRADDQRGFTYSYGMALQTPRRAIAASVTRFPVLSIRSRVMGVIEASQASAGGAVTAGTTTTLTATSPGWAVNQWRGRMLNLLAFTSGTATAGGANTLTDTGRTWGVNQWAGLQIRITGGTGNGQVRTISSNTANAITVSSNWTTNPDATSTYVVENLNSLSQTARITDNTANVLTFADIVTGGAALTVAPGQGAQYQIGVINRGQILPQTLVVSSDGLCQVELITSTTASPIVLTGANFQALSGIGSANSFAERDVSATAIAGGEVVYGLTAPAGGSGLLQLDLAQLFALYNTVRGNIPDILTVAVTTPSGAGVNVGANLVCQEAMS